MSAFRTPFHVLPILGAVLIAPVLPKMQDHFASVPGAKALVPLALTVPALALALLAPFAGVIVDRVGRKRLLVVATVLYALFGTAPLWLDSLGGIIASRALVGVAEAAIMTCCTTLIGDYYSGHRRVKYLALQTMCASASATVFFVLGGAAGSAGWRVPFWVHAVSLEGAGQDAHRGRSDRLARQALLDHRDPAGALDHEGQQLEGLHGHLHLGTDPYHAELAGGRGVVGTLVDGPGQTPQLVQGEFVTDLGVIVGDQEQPAVLVEVDGGQAVDDAVRHQQSVDGAQHRGGVLHDGRCRVLEGEPDAGRLLVQGAGECGTEHGRSVVGGEQGELT
jgi:hypothetical protein